MNIIDIIEMAQDIMAMLQDNGVIYFILFFDVKVFRNVSFYMNYHSEKLTIILDSDATKKQTQWRQPESARKK